MMHIDHEGVITAPKKFRGSVQKVQNEYVDYMLEQADNNADYSRIIINYTGMEKPLIDTLVKRVKDYGKFEDIVVSQTNCTVATHGGPNTISLSFLDK
jgi:fatty acid-binding protein DegV